MSKHGVYGVPDSDDLQSAWSDIDFDNAILCSWQSVHCHS